MLLTVMSSLSWVRNFLISSCESESSNSITSVLISVFFSAGFAGLVSVRSNSLDSVLCFFIDVFAVLGESWKETAWLAGPFGWLVEIYFWEIDFSTGFSGFFEFDGFGFCRLDFAFFKDVDRGRFSSDLGHGRFVTIDTMFALKLILSLVRIGVDWLSPA